MSTTGVGRADEDGGEDQVSSADDESETDDSDSSFSSSHEGDSSTSDYNENNDNKLDSDKKATDTASTTTTTTTTTTTLCHPQKPAASNACTEEKEIFCDSNTPDDIVVESIIFGLDFHPTEELIVCGDIDGNLMMYKYSTVENELRYSRKQHKSACRSVAFSLDGKNIWTSSKDKSIKYVTAESAEIVKKYPNAHECPIYSMCVINENCLATGDDDGFVKLWDLRSQGSIMEFKEPHSSYIADMEIDGEQRQLVVASGDGTISAFNVKKQKFLVQSENLDAEMLSLAFVKNGEKIVCGSGDGSLNIFNYGEWGNISDRFPGHPSSVDCCIPVSDDIICTGCMDGSIRAVSILPNRILGLVGNHGDNPIEHLSLSHDQRFLASCGHDLRIRFWNVIDLENLKINTKRKAKNSSKVTLTNKRQKLKQSFFADLDS